ncbi:MAG TPA: S41 family peptidase [Candidatus Dormibacteraeota bacterium]|jgi:carboxyl-terminal processing protease|nr:S41 family peptidase [Candidatus Dormibacteraeota bacterium]
MKPRVTVVGGVVVVVVLLMTFGFGIGVYVDQAFPDALPFIAHHSTGRIDTTELQQAIRVIEADYVDSNLDTTKLSHGTVQGLITSLNDPFSAYYDPQQYKRLQDVYAGHYSGIGIYLTFSASYPVITGTVPGSPAATAGLQAGDQIVKVGDKDMKGITSDQATALIQGVNGSKVTLTLQRGAQTFSVTVTRAEIQVPSVRSTVIADHILYVRIYQFSSTTTDEFHAALNSGLAGAKGLVLDLREDPGGFISEADHVISQFVANGETFELRDRSGTVDKHTVSGEHLATAVPLVVLVDANSASASEIVAGSLQVHQRAKLVGTVTFGKGSVQQDFPLNDGADIHLTVKRWYLPNGQTIDHKGLTPDISVPLAAAADEFDVQQPALGYAKDAQLNAALAVLTGG